MNRSAVLFSAALATLLIGGPAFAQKDTSGTPKSTESTPKSTESTPKSSTDRSSQGTTTPPAEKPGVLSMPHHVTGSVVSVNKKNNSVAVKDQEGKELTLRADAETAAELSRLKVGDHVKITYKKSKDQMVATKITMDESSSSRGTSPSTSPSTAPSTPPSTSPSTTPSNPPRTK